MPAATVCGPEVNYEADAGTRHGHVYARSNILLDLQPGCLLSYVTNRHVAPITRSKINHYLEEKTPVPTGISSLSWSVNDRIAGCLQ